MHTVTATKCFLTSLTDLARQFSVLWKALQAPSDADAAHAVKEKLPSILGQMLLTVGGSVPQDLTLLVQRILSTSSSV